MRDFRFVVLIGVLPLLAACADTYLPVDAQGRHTAVAPRSPVSDLALAPPVTSARGDICGAASLQYLIGKPKAEAPVPIDPSRRRVYCSTCMITMDYRADRLDIVFDQTSGLVTAVKCG